MKSLVWLRSDIRLDDNPAIKNAFIQSEFVHVLYLYSKKQLKLHNESDIKISFLIENLKDLENSLDQLNTGLTVIETDGFSSDPAEVLKFLKIIILISYFLIILLELMKIIEILKL